MIYYTVFDSTGKKVADCGTEEAAKWLADVRQGTYKTNRLEWNQIIDIKLSQLELPAEPLDGLNDDVHDGWWLRDHNQKLFSESNLETFIPNLHD